MNICKINPYTVFFYPNGRFVYVTNFGEGTISLYDIESATGILAHIKDMDGHGTMPGAMRVESSGNYFYVVYPREDKIQAFKIDPNNGDLTYIENSEVDTGISPRIMSITDKYAYVINEQSSTILMYQIDPNSKLLAIIYTRAQLAWTWSFKQPARPFWKTNICVKPMVK